MVGSDSYNPICTEIDLNTAYTLEPVSGVDYCVYLSINDRSRTEFFVLQQNSGRQVSLEVLEDDGDGNFTSHGLSQSNGPEDSVLIFTDTGHYYMWMPAHSGDGGGVLFGAATNTNIDPYEPNDTFDNSYELPGGRNSIPGNLDYVGDIDYYYFESSHGENVALGLEDPTGSGQWLLEVLSGSDWQVLDNNVNYRISGLSSGQRVYVRIRHNPSELWSGDWYNLNIGPAIDSMDQVDAWTTENLTRINYGFVEPYLTTQVHNEIRWTSRVKDSSGEPLSGVEVVFHVNADSFPYASQAAYTDSLGVAEGLIVLPNCTSSENPYSVVHSYLSGGNTEVWRSTFHFGEWAIEVPDAFPEDNVGVGGGNVPSVVLGHICSQEFLGFM